MMKRMGKYTGTIYDEDYDFSKCPECCVCIPDDKLNDEEYLKNLRTKILVDCAISCPGGCPASTFGKGVKSC